MTWNLMHLARMLRAAGGIPAYGNIRSGWDAGDTIRFRKSGLPLSRCTGHDVARERLERTGRIGADIGRSASAARLVRRAASITEAIRPAVLT